MKRKIVVLSFLILATRGLEAQEAPSIPADFHHRYVQVPLDHRSPEGETFSLYYELSSNFDFKRPTVFYIVDSQQSARGADRLKESYEFSDSLNLVLIEYRGRTYSHIDFEKEDGSVDWERAYHLMASHQAVEDIDAVRRDLFRDHPDTKIHLYGRSGGAYLIHEYLAKHSEHAARAFTRAAPNPLVMHQLGNPESKAFMAGLEAVDPRLPGKLNTVLERETVSSRQLLWLLLQLPYSDPNASDLQAQIISELYEGNATTYESYRAEPRLNLTSELISQLVGYMGPGSLLRPLECDGPYILGPEPDYVDPVYPSFRYISEPFISLIEEGGLPEPDYPPLESYQSVETEVFYLAGRRDHMSPWPIAVELDKWFPNYSYFIADDTHTMSEHPECYPILRNSFFLFGTDSAEFAESRRSPHCLEWDPDEESRD